MSDFSGYIHFRLDPLFSGETRRKLEATLAQFPSAEVSELGTALSVNGKLLVDFVSEGALHSLRGSDTFKICLIEENQGLFSFGQNIDASAVDAVLDESIDAQQLAKLLRPLVSPLSRAREKSFQETGVKNLRKFEAKVKTSIQKESEQGKVLSSEELLEYTHRLIDLEKDLIHIDDVLKVEKILKQFTKTYIEKTKISLHLGAELWNLEPSRNILPLPRHKGHFLAFEMNWDDDSDRKLIQRYFFYSTVMTFFYSRQEVQDPFVDEDLWEGVLDSIPFPVGLLSENGEVHQHNSLFAKLGFAPQDCLKLRLREKILIQDIPYNVYRKEIFHMDEKKVLLVFFTESFFLKGEGNLTPSGQELGIISSSIAHELNNPIAGIQAALSLLMLDDDMGEEARQTMVEMKNGAHRCKQLIETFLGFSRANPAALNIEHKISPVDLCYQQAQNLLRFRTVESGIRLSLEYSRHTEFRATVNVSLLTMTFYLILGELMTLYSHQLLVSGKNQVEKVIRGEIIESSQEIQFQLHELNISSLTLSKLIQNLLNIENFVLQISEYSLRFIYNPPRS